MRARVDLPAAEGPITPSAEPAESWNVAPCSTGFCWPGGATQMPSTCSDLTGLGSASGIARSGCADINADNRTALCRAPMKPRQLAIAISTGASARDTRIDAAIITPPVACPMITR